MNTIPMFGISDYANRLFSLEVQSCNTEAAVREKNHIIKVSFSCLAQTIQSIHRLGGTVINVTLLSTVFPLSFNTGVQEANPITSQPAATESQTTTAAKNNTRKSATLPVSQTGKPSEKPEKRGRGGKPRPKN